MLTKGQKNYDIVRSVDELQEFFDKMVAEGQPIGFDIETGYHGEDDDRGSLKQETNLLVGFSFTNSLHWARYCPLAHDFAENILDHVGVARILWTGLNSGLIVAHNAGFELRRMSRFFREQLSEDPIFGAAVRASRGYFPVLSCTQVEAYIAREFQEFSLKELVLNKFQHQMIKFEELFDHLTEKKKKAFRFNVLDLSAKVITYACEDALWCLALHLTTYPQVKDMLVYKVDMEVTYVICDMEDCGIRYDWFFMQEAAQEAKEFTSELNNEIQLELADLLDMPGTALNVNLGSPKQLSEILFDRLGLSVNVYTTSTKGAARGDKKMSTGKQALEILADKHPIAKKISTWKNMKRLTTSFLEKYAKDYGNSPDGMVHPSLNQSYVRTARFSSANPNQQNQPSVNLKADDGEHLAKCNSDTCKGCKTPLSYNYKLNNGKAFRLNFRDSVIAPEDYYILGFDLSQAEYRAAAGLAKELALVEAFEKNEDVHTKVAMMMFKLTKEEVTKEYRSKAKTIGFGLLFGMTPMALAKRLNCSKEEAEDLFNQYFTAFPRLKRWTEKQIEFGYANGYVATVFGRKIPIWELTDSRRWIREGGERACFNYPVQGGATGDYVRLGMVRARKAIIKAGWQDKVKLFMNVHDALEYYVHRSLNPADVIQVLQPAVIFPVPGWPSMKADWHVGKRWGSVKEITVLEDGSISLEGGHEIHPTRNYILTYTSNEEGSSSEEPSSTEDQDASKDSESEGSTGTIYLPTLQTQPMQLQVSIDHMPTEDQLSKFSTLVKNVPGDTTIVLETPEGGIIWWMPSGLDPETHKDVISLALGGASARYVSSAVSAVELTDGLEF